MPASFVSGLSFKYKKKLFASFNLISGESFQELIIKRLNIKKYINNNYQILRKICLTCLALG